MCFCHHCLLCLNIGCNICLYRKELDHVHKKREKTYCDRWMKSLFTQGASYTFSTWKAIMKGWTLPEFYGCCGFDQMLFWLPVALLLSSTATVSSSAHFHCQMRLLHQSVPKISFFSIIFLKNLHHYDKKNIIFCWEKCSFILVSISTVVFKLGSTEPWGSTKVKQWTKLVT
jgi:hypothetical protein